MILRALSIRQPWLWAILFGNKGVENRDWPACHYRGPILLHGGKTCSAAEYQGASVAIARMRDDSGLPPLPVPPLDSLPRGALLGIARITRTDRHPKAGVWIVPGPDGKTRRLHWSRGHVGFRIAGALGLQLADVLELPPVTYSGQRGFFNVPSADLPPAYLAAWRDLEAMAKAARRQEDNDAR